MFWGDTVSLKAPWVLAEHMVTIIVLAQCYFRLSLQFCSEVFFAFWIFFDIIEIECVCVLGRTGVKADVSRLRMLTLNLACEDFDIKVG